MHSLAQHRRGADSITEAGVKACAVPEKKTLLLLIISLYQILTLRTASYEKGFEFDSVSVDQPKKFLQTNAGIIHSFCSLSYDRSVDSSKTSSPQSAI